MNGVYRFIESICTQDKFSADDPCLDRDDGCSVAVAARMHCQTLQTLQRCTKIIV